LVRIESRDTCATCNRVMTWRKVAVVIVILLWVGEILMSTQMKKMFCYPRAFIEYFSWVFRTIYLFNFVEFF
jgi:hypothetical protein